VRLERGEFITAESWEDGMERWGERTRDRRGVRLLVVAALGTLTSLGCDVQRMTSPTRVEPAAKPSPEVILEEDGLSQTCGPNDPWCGGVHAFVRRDFNGQYLRISSSELGGYIRTWSPTGQTAYISVAGQAIVRRGNQGASDYSETAVPLNTPDKTGSDIGTGFQQYNTCSSQRNEVIMTSSHHALPPGFTFGYHGVGSDIDLCAGPANQIVAACDSYGNYVDYGGDPANCPPADDGSGDDPFGQTGSGIQYYPGDYTNGETVNFQTGIGDGGNSVCGSAAQVEQVCIDFWNDETQTWGNSTCGYATTC
jgi:hypothetical protein